MTLGTSSTSLGIPTATQLPGVFTFATLPPLPGTAAGALTAYTSDLGLCIWIGTAWASVLSGAGGITLNSPITINAPATTVPSLVVNGAPGAAVMVLNGGDVAGLNINSTAAANRSQIALQQAGSPLARIGVDGTQFLLTDSTNGDLCIVSTSQNIRFGLSGGATKLLIANSGATTISANTASSAFKVSNAQDSAVSFLSSGVTKGIRFEHAAGGSTIDGVDNTGTGSFQPITIQGTIAKLSSSTGNLGVTVSPGGAVTLDLASSSGWGTPANGVVVASYNATTEGGTNTTKAMAQVLSILKTFGLLAA